MDKEKVMNFTKKYTMIIALVLVTMFFFIKTGGKVLWPQNVSNLVSQNAYVFVLASGMLFCILTGGNIDLSIGSVVCFVGSIGATMMETKGLNFVVSIIIMISFGLLIGAWQGFWIAYVRIPPFIVTLAGMLVFRGLSNIVLQGLTVPLTNQTYIKLFGGGAECYVPDIFGMKGFNLTCMLFGILICIIYILLQCKSRINKTRKGYETEPLHTMLLKVIVICLTILAFFFRLSQYEGIPTALIWVLIVVLVYGYISSKTTVGRHFYAVGGNEKATRLSGINTNRVYFLAYLNMGFLSAIAGMLTIARLTSAQPTYGANYEMDAIGACFIGGASAYGGIGTIPGVIVGAVLMGVINLGMSIMSVDANYQKVVKGLVLLAAVIFDVVSKRSERKA
ncbi:multiple monosaccharide ABC transporter permease [Lachnoclostridium phytofermentans]|uniref:Xylose transport system permease protein XylH n=1 Tax=Lachnoclostridium phytofermentans (strain ATCC 700394 / DSM 18823 / ISDg) TaxID=357809 RepID=A9KQP8_LACP7|nr:multiple monosaccharide ABC transporter permease [Lachnoclostridium phytofermentans]ABX41961.1 Monosaccharide-transporting ATPase [Lachnoclostridium phytofermentans ISDg]